MEFGWIIEKYNDNVGLGYAADSVGDFEWVGFSDERLIILDTREDAELFIFMMKIEGAFTAEHGWILEDLNEI